MLIRGPHTGEPKITQNKTPVPGQEDIGRFEIAVKVAAGMGVGKGEEELLHEIGVTVEWGATTWISGGCWCDDEVEWVGVVVMIIIVVIVVIVYSIWMIGLIAFLTKGCG